MGRGKAITTLKGIGPKMEEALNKLGIFTTEDLLYHLPHRYEDETQVSLLKDAPYNEKRSFIVQILSKDKIIRKRKGLFLQKFLVEDQSSVAEVVFFNQPYIDKSFFVGDRIRLYGQIKKFQGIISLASPKIEKISDGNPETKVQPIYPLIANLSSKRIAYFVEQALKSYSFQEFIPRYLIDRYQLMSRKEAFYTLHKPKNMDNIVQALNRLKFEEFLLFQLALGSLKKEKNQKGSAMLKEDLVLDILSELPYELTSGQKKAWDEIRYDMRSGKAMNRLVQGDVGSGKTILAILAIAKCVENGYQAMFMAPTEILAMQHMDALKDIFGKRGVMVELLTGSTSIKRKREILSNIEMGLCDVLVGTHALIEDAVKIPNLGLTITDEQHRFGVLQRKKLQDKRESSHNLVMTATPIPRTLGYVLYGDMDISTIDTLPEGRQPIETIVVGKNNIDKSYEFMRKQLEKGHQIYVICPLIEENDKLSLDSAVKVFENLQNNIFPAYNVELLHGKMKNELKKDIMERFSKNQTNILVSTTVIEVGVNVPNANLLFVYNADRFGLATLHQLRGRVGRGNTKAYCILYSETDKELAWERLNIIQNSTDGFYIAEKDMELRGLGDFFGTRQSGLANFRLGNPVVDSDIMKYARIEAEAIHEGNHLNVSELPALYLEVEEHKKLFFIKD